MGWAEGIMNLPPRLTHLLTRTLSWLREQDEVLVITHIDADGISAGAIMSSMLTRLGIPFTIHPIQTLDANALKRIIQKKTPVIFTDLGSGQVSLLNELLAEFPVLILDHHDPQGELTTSIAWHINPHEHGIDGGREISGAGTTYLLARMAGMRDLAYAAIIGALGDVQEDGAFHGLNQQILADAEADGSILTERTLTVYGLHSRPLVRLLQYNRDIALRGVYGSEHAARNFLHQLGIPAEREGRPIRYHDLTREERERLIAALLIQQGNGNVRIGTAYLLADEPPGSPLRDAREFATILNACGRMDMASIGIAAVLNDPGARKRAVSIHAEYRRAISEAMRWYKHALAEGLILQEENLIIIDGRGIIRPQIIGTIASIISYDEHTPPGTIILSIAQADDESCKVSIRIAQRDGENMHHIMQQLIAGIPGAAAGGHENAAGAILPCTAVKQLISRARMLISQMNSS